MIIEIAAQGGFGGIAATTMHKRIDVDMQTASLRQELCQALAPNELARLAQQPCPGCADRLTYRITVTQQGREPQDFTLREDQLPARTLDLIDRF